MATARPYGAVGERRARPARRGERCCAATLADAADGVLPADRVDPAHSLPALHATAIDRARWYGRKLAEQYHAEGEAGLIGDEITVDADGVEHKTGEFVRGLARLEAGGSCRAGRRGGAGATSAPRRVATPSSTATTRRRWLDSGAGGRPTRRNRGRIAPRRMPAIAI